jgi:hypothetical protein
LLDKHKLSNAAIISTHGKDHATHRWLSLKMENFVVAVRAQELTKAIRGHKISIASHLTVFAAERARLTGTVQEISLA